ncbi:MAG: phage holin family protein [Myxococcales bacterium]|nr:phage holin family protein [Polyangiaceae bacterium]MDW8248063.1 phage holin family protein [Myxococcales bacterium]
MLTPLDVKILIHLLVTGGSIALVGWLLPGVRVKSLGHAVLFSCLLALLNAALWSQLGTVPGVSRELSSGLGSLLLNGAIFYLVGKITPGIEVSGCLTASLAAFLVSFLNGLLHGLLRDLLR